MANTLLRLPALCVIIILLYGPLVQAVVQRSDFDKADLDDLLFNDNVLFDLSNNNNNEKKVRSLLDCARHCAGRVGCKIFTYFGEGSGIRSCRGYSSTSVTFENAHENVIGARTYLMSVEEDGAELRDPCVKENYMVIDDEKRDVKNTVFGNVCDKDAWTPGWYRFYLRGEDAIVPMSCIQSYRCGTHGTMWLDLQGAALPSVGQELSVTACSSISGLCCYSVMSINATLRNCGTFFVYYLLKSRSYCYGYCVEFMRP